MNPSLKTSFMFCQDQRLTGGTLFMSMVWFVYSLKFKAHHVRSKYPISFSANLTYNGNSSVRTFWPNNFSICLNDAKSSVNHTPSCSTCGRALRINPHTCLWRQIQIKMRSARAYQRAGIAQTAGKLCHMGS